MSKEVWILAFMTFVNRAGSMVLPFLSLYLTEDMELSLERVGWIMSCFGAGSVVGSWIGGKLTDKVGFYPVMVAALFTSGVAFIGLQFVHEFKLFCMGVFVLSVFSDSFRPALFVAIRGYSSTENRTRAVTLIRLAINLGFSMGPAIGGIIITTLSYSGLFWVDGLTCIAAAALLLILLPAKQLDELEEAKEVKAIASPYRDKPFLFFLLINLLISIPFLQYFSTMPLFYSQVHHLTEAQIGMLMGFNGLLIFLIEMPLIKYCEVRNFKMIPILIASSLLIGLSFIVINLFPIVGFLWVGMAFMTIGEMLNFPYMNRFAYDRSERGLPGSYMALFTIGWSVAHIIGHTVGLQSVDKLGFHTTWYLAAVMLLIAALLFIILGRMLDKESQAETHAQKSKG